MKNKHLVLLVLGILLALGASRWWPKCGKDRFDVPLLRIDTAMITDLFVSDRQGQSISIVKTDGHWLIRRGDDEPVIQNDSIGQALAWHIKQLKIRQILKTDRPDTLGFQMLGPHVVVQYRHTQHMDELLLGKQTMVDGRPGTWVSMGLQLYLVDGHLRDLLSVDYDGLLSEATFQLPEKNTLRAVSITTEKDTFLLLRDSIWHLNTPELALTDADTVDQWIRTLAGWAHGPRDRHFDETRKRDLLFATIQITGADSTQTLRLYKVDMPHLSDDPTERPKGVFKPYMVVESDVAGGYTALPDTATVRTWMRLLTNYLRVRESTPPRAIKRSYLPPNGR
jgi:hypothetical protein